MQPCPTCGSSNVGRSPTGDWCNECGWAYPGLKCNVCGREGVNVKHRHKDGTSQCEADEAKSERWA